jgi:hypothetical protein
MQCMLHQFGDQEAKCGVILLRRNFQRLNIAYVSIRSSPPADPLEDPKTLKTLSLLLGDSPMARYIGWAGAAVNREHR